MYLTDHRTIGLKAVYSDYYQDTQAQSINPPGGSLVCLAVKLCSVFLFKVVFSLKKKKKREHPTVVFSCPLRCVFVRQR